MDIKVFIAEEEGATAIEYGLIAAIIGLGIIVGSVSMGAQINQVFSDISTELQSASTVN